MPVDALYNPWHGRKQDLPPPPHAQLKFENLKEELWLAWPRSCASDSSYGQVEGLGPREVTQTLLRGNCYTWATAIVCHFFSPFGTQFKQPVKILYLIHWKLFKWSLLWLFCQVMDFIFNETLGSSPILFCVFTRTQTCTLCCGVCLSIIFDWLNEYHWNKYVEA